MDILFGNHCGSKSKYGNTQLANAIETRFMNGSAMVSAIAGSEMGICEYSCTDPCPLFANPWLPRLSVCEDEGVNRRCSVKFNLVATTHVVA